MPNVGAAAQAGLILYQDYQQNRSNSAICQYLQLERGAPLGRNPFLRGQWERLCEPFDENPPPPPTQEFFNNGGDPCRLYRVTFESGTVGQAPTVSQFNLRGPIRTTKTTGTDSQGNPTVQYRVLGGNDIGCPITSNIMASSSNTNIQNVFANVLSIEPLEGDPLIDTPIPRPRPEPPTPPPPFGFEINVEVDGLQLEIPVNFEFPITNNFGPFIPFQFAPTANFNLNLDADFNNNPRFGIDLDLEFVIPLGPGGGNGNPDGPVEPVPVPGFQPPVTVDCPEVDYQRIEDIVEAAKCCKPITGTQTIGTAVFSGPNDVFTYSLPANTVAVFLGLIPGPNTRVYKFAGAQAEYAHGNASLLVSGNAIKFERLYVNNHVLFFPDETANKGIRLSCQEGTTVVVSAGTYTPEA